MAPRKGLASKTAKNGFTGQGKWLPALPRPTERVGERSDANTDSDGRYVSISYLQEYARDEVGATDILFIPETCYGGWDGLPIATSTGCKDYTLCETLAAGDGDLTICSDIDWDTYSSRIIGTLSRNARYGLRVQELHELIHDPTITEAPGFYRSDGIQNDGGEVRSILLAPMRGSPAARRIAGYKVPSPRQLRSIPDTPMLGRHLTKEERAFLATWSIEQKRVLERLIREKKEESPTLRAARLNGVFMRAAIFQPFTSQEQPYAMKSAEDCARAEKILSRG